MTNYTPGATRHIPLNLLETAYEDTGKYLNRDDLEVWAFRRFAQLESERDALAAHVERLNEAGKVIRHELAQWALTERDPETSAAMCQFDHVARETPATSLARRDAQIKADQLSQFISVYLTPGLAHNRATGELQALRKQAEGHQ